MEIEDIPLFHLIAISPNSDQYPSDLAKIVNSKVFKNYYQDLIIESARKTFKTVKLFICRMIEMRTILLLSAKCPWCFERR